MTKRLPDFLIPGAQKSGSTWLRSMLSQHPEVYMYPHEIHYFDHKDKFIKGADWYAAHFAKAAPHQKAAEKTPNYFSTEKDGPVDMPRTIYELLPDIKMIFILRDPTKRAISGINHDMTMGSIDPDARMEDLVPTFIKEDAHHIWYGYYYRHAMSYLKYYDREQMLFITLEQDVKRKPSETLTRVCEFLGIDATFDFDGLKQPRNVFRASKPELRLMSLMPYPFDAAYRAYVMPQLHSTFDITPHRLPAPESVIEQLNDLYREENEKFFDFLGYRIDEWGA